MRQYMHVWFATLLFFSFSMYSGDGEIAQSFAMAIKEIQAEINELSGDYKEMIQQFKDDFEEDEYQETRAQLKKTITKAMKSRKIKSDMAHVVGLIIDNMKNEKYPFEGDVREKFDDLVSSFIIVVGKRSNIKVLNEKVASLMLVMGGKTICVGLLTLLIEKMKAEIA